jgi:hypothetical protein
VKPEAFKMLKYANQDIKESAKLNCADLWTDVTDEHKNEIWQTENQDEQGTMKED